MDNKVYNVNEELKIDVVIAQYGLTLEVKHESIQN